MRDTARISAQFFLISGGGVAGSAGVLAGWLGGVPPPARAGTARSQPSRRRRSEGGVQRGARRWSWAR